MDGYLFNFFGLDARKAGVMESRFKRIAGDAVDQGFMGKQVAHAAAQYVFYIESDKSGFLFK